MSRFTFERPPALTEVVAAKGKEHEVTFSVPTPVGKYWSDTALELLEIVNKFQAKFDEHKNQAEAAVGAFSVLLKNKHFWDKLLPSALGIKGTKDEKAGKKYLEEALLPIEVITIFMEAASEIVNHAFQGDEVDEALTKSEGGEDGEGEQDQNSDGSMPPQ